MRRVLICLLCFVCSPLPALAASYSLSITTTADEETVVNKRYKRTCKDRIANTPPQPELPNCTPDCLTCTPTNANKATLMETWVNDRIDNDAAALKTRKSRDTGTAYYQAAPSVQSQIDALTGVQEPEL